ncbi:MAG: carnitine--CoA ligase [Clostridiales bacterium]|nr:carnitine--CoA ligase [Clostridiales bacterium]
MIDIIECCMCKKITKANLILKNNNICEDCEKKIIGTKTDHQDYLKYKEGIKRLLCYSHQDK